MFSFLHGISKNKVYNIRCSLENNGLMSRIHGNAHRNPHNALTLARTPSVVMFLHSFAEQHAILHPGHIPGYSRCDIKILPSSLSKRTIWKIYSSSLSFILTSTIGLLKHFLTLSMRMLYWTSWPDNADAVALQLDKMIINA